MCIRDSSNTKEIGTIPYSKFIERSSNTNAIDWIRKNYHPQYSIKKWKDGIEEICGCSLHYTTVFSEIGESQKATVAKNPYFKSNYLNIMRYFSWGGLNVAKIPDAVIIGAGTMGIRIAQWMLDCNKRKTTWFIKGFLDEHIESLNNTDVYKRQLPSYESLLLSRYMWNHILFLSDIPFSFHLSYESYEMELIQYLHHIYRDTPQTQQDCPLQPSHLRQSL